MVSCWAHPACLLGSLAHMAGPVRLQTSSPSKLQSKTCRFGMVLIIFHAAGSTGSTTVLSMAAMWISLRPCIGSDRLGPLKLCLPQCISWNEPPHPAASHALVLTAEKRHRQLPPARPTKLRQIHIACAWSWAACPSRVSADTGLVSSLSSDSLRSLRRDDFTGGSSCMGLEKTRGHSAASAVPRKSGPGLLAEQGS